MPRYAVAMVLHKKECGLYSRTLREALAMRIAEGADKCEAAEQVKRDLETNSYPLSGGWIVWSWEAIEVPDA